MMQVCSRQYRVYSKVIVSAYLQSLPITELPFDGTIWGLFPRCFIYKTDAVLAKHLSILQMLVFRTPTYACEASLLLTCKF